MGSQIKRVEDRNPVIPARLSAMTIALSGVLSAFLVNDIVCLALTPLVIHLARRLRIDPLPHLIGLATAADIGSTATLTGNPQNMIIGVLSMGDREVVGAGRPMRGGVIFNRLPMAGGEANFLT
jgi:di/tricarboxylate transporter